MQLPKPEAIIFDWDGTIVDTLGLVNESMNHVRVRHGLSPYTVEQTRADSVHRGEVIFRRDFGEELADARRAEFLEYFRANHLTRFGTAAAHPECLSGPGFMPGAVALLDYLQSIDMPCGVLTHRLRDTMGPEIPYLGYQDFFKAVVCSGEGPKGKPEPEAAFYTLDLMGLKASPAVWLVGDTHGDITCALAAGLTPILVQSEAYNHPSQPALQVKDCGELLKILQGLS